jgi:maltose-binding protein MalE
MVFVAVDTILIKPFTAKETYRASRYVYTEKYGNVMIVLPEATRKKYSISFFEENKKPVFQIKEIKSPSLVVDKSNFVHAGWFWFELYEEGKLKERHRFFIPKDF